jgi:ABC-2 type transport system permease protein
MKKTTFRIAIREWQALFYSPVGWLVLLIFCLVHAFVFTQLFSAAAADYRAGWPVDRLTKGVFTSLNGNSPGVLGALQTNLYFYIPLVTMGVMSREISSGSIKLLLSSPVTIPEIVLGKFLALMAYGALLIGIMLSFGVIAACYIPHFETGWLLAALLGIYLLYCCYAAIGLFMSSLSGYPMIAAIGTLVVLAGLNYMGQVGQNMALMRSITYYLQLSNRTDQFMQGLISSRNIFYYLNLIFFFLALTILGLQSKRRSWSPLKRLGNYGALAGVCLFTGYISSLPALRGYSDWTAGKENTISPGTQKLLKALPSPLRIHTYVNIIDRDAGFGRPNQQNNNSAFFEEYQRFAPDLSIDYTYYYDTPADKSLLNAAALQNLDSVARLYAQYGSVDFDQVLSPEAIRAKIDLTGQQEGMIWRLESGGRTTWLRVFNDIFVYPFESEVAAAMKRLSVKPPVLRFVCGNGERGIDQPGDLAYYHITSETSYRGALINQGFDVTAWTADSPTMGSRAGVVVLADPQTPLSAVETDRIRSYIDSGGNLLVAATVSDENVIHPILAALGIHSVVDSLRGMQGTPDSAILIPWVATNEDSTDSLGLILEDAGSLLLGKPLGLLSDGSKGFTVQPIAMAEPASGMAGHGDNRVPVALAMTRTVRGREQRIIVIGDGGFMSDRTLERKDIPNSNKDFAMDLFGWLSNDEFPVPIPGHIPQDSAIPVPGSAVSLIRTLLVIVLPLLLLLAGLRLWLVRKNN